MNREILFRGKRTDNGEWVEGHLIVYPKTKRTKIMVWEWADLEFNAIEVRPETVGQFTGLTDKNGKKVFEGDILKFPDTNAEYEWIGKVEFGNPNSEYNWGFQLVYVSGTEPNTDILLWFDMEETGAFSEVVGNIHDNPELLTMAAKKYTIVYRDYMRQKTLTQDTYSVEIHQATLKALKLNRFCKIVEVRINGKKVEA